MRILITGAGGFVGGHLAAAAADAGDEVIAVGREPAAPPGLPGDWYTVDLLDADAVAAVVRDTKPDHVAHLAAQASVADSWRNPRETLDSNLATTLNVLEAVVAEAPSARVLLAGSGEQFGPVAPERLPVVEDEPLRPQNPYAVSKCACDLLGGFYSDAGRVEVVRTRSFNHAGPGQHERYVIASFARQLAAAEAEGRDEVTVRTGDTRPRRDFTDVRDVVHAYRLLLGGAPSDAYNVCRGESLSVADILAGLARLTSLAVHQRTDPELLRDNEVMEIRGSHEKLTRATGWEPRLPIERTFEDVLDSWRAEFASGATR